jgi:hypothetical protein
MQTARRAAKFRAIMGGSGVLAGWPVPIAVNDNHAGKADYWRAMLTSLAHGRGDR